MLNEGHFYETILNFDQWFKGRCLLNIFLIYNSGGKNVQKSRTICAFVEECIMRNISVKKIEFGPVVQEMLFKDISTRPGSTVANISDCRNVSYFRSRGGEFIPGSVPYFCRD